MATQLQTLRRGDSLAAWQLSAIRATPFAGEPAPAHDPQDYRYINGFVDVGDLPCRVATWREVAGRQRQLETDWAVETLYLPGANRRVEFTQFRHMPTHLERWCRTWLAPDRDGYVSFRLSTRGGVHIWVDGALAARFEPFTRNSTESTVVHLPLLARGSEVVVVTEDMAERDTIWFFELVALDDRPIAVTLPGASASTESLALARLAAEVRCLGDYVVDGPVRLLFDSPATEDVTITASIGSTSHDRSASMDVAVLLPAGELAVDLCLGSALAEGYASIALVLTVGTARVERHIGCPVVRSTAPQHLTGDLAARKRQVIEHLARHGELRMGTALAMLAFGTMDEERFRLILERTLAVVEERHDCSDFVLVPLLWAYARHGEAFPAHLRERAQAAILGFRYWVDEPGNDVMWFWSENHALCFHVSQLLAGHLFPDAVFTASGRTGAAQLALALQRLDRWFDAVEEDGLAEWNSAAYYPVDFIGLLALAEWAPPALSLRATAACDRIFTMLALHTTGGVPAGSMGRAYDKELCAGPLTELAPFATLAWGRGWLNNGVASLPQFAAGGYVPPAGLEQLAWPKPGTTITAHYRQGYGDAARLHLFKTAQLQLSTNAASKAGSYGHQQHVVDLLFADNPFARAWINHPGEDDPWGTQRPSYWAGNGVLPKAGQQRNVALLRYDLGMAPRLAFTHAYIASGVIAVDAAARCLILRSGDGYAAIVSTADLVPTTAGPAAGREWRAHGTTTGWAIIASDHTDFDRFQREVAAATLTLTGDGLVLTTGGNTFNLNWATGLSGPQEGRPGVEPQIVVSRKD